MAKYQAPENFGGLTTPDGKTYSADKKGLVSLPDTFSADIAASFGLFPAGAAQVAADTDPPVDPNASTTAPAQ